MTLFLLFFGFANAEWSIWDSSKYCDFSQTILGEWAASQLSCEHFCQLTDTSDSAKCCDFENWADGSVDCTLYLGARTLVNSCYGQDTCLNEYASMRYNIE